MLSPLVLITAVPRPSWSPWLELWMMEDVYSGIFEGHVYQKRR
jgi:hypothetical protein